MPLQRDPLDKPSPCIVPLYMRLDRCVKTIVYRAPHFSQVTNLALRSLLSQDVREGRLERAAAAVLAVEVGGGKGQRRGSLVVRLHPVVLRVEVIRVGRKTKVCVDSCEALLRLVAKALLASVDSTGMLLCL